MHEFAIANSIKDIVLENISEHIDMSAQNIHKEPFANVESVRVQYGLLSQIVPEILLEAYDAVKSDYPFLKNSKLELECIMPLVECSSCKKEFSIEEREELFLPCPLCKQIASHKLIKGKELLVAHIEVTEK